MHKNKKYTLLTTALQDHLIKELNLDLNVNINSKPLPKHKTIKSVNQSKSKAGITNL